MLLENDYFLNKPRNEDVLNVMKAIDPILDRIAETFWNHIVRLVEERFAPFKLKYHAFGYHVKNNDEMTQDQFRQFLEENATGLIRRPMRWRAPRLDEWIIPCGILKIEAVYDDIFEEIKKNKDHSGKRGELQSVLGNHVFRDKISASCLIEFNADFFRAEEIWDRSKSEVIPTFYPSSLIMVFLKSEYGV